MHNSNCSDHFRKRGSYISLVALHSDAFYALTTSAPLSVTPESSILVVPTYASVIDTWVVHPAEGLLHFSLQGHSRLGWSHVGHSPIGFGLQGQECSSYLLCECTGLWGVTFTPKTQRLIMGHIH